MTSQRRNAELVGLLSPEFQNRYEPNFAIGNAISTLLALPELRGLWPFSLINESGNALDLSGQDRTLTNNATTPRLVTGLVPYISLNGTTRYFSRADEAGLDITGGLTIGCWVKPSALGVAGTEGITGKYATVGNQRSYAIHLNASGGATFAVSVDGTAGAGLINQVSCTDLDTTNWHFLVGRFTPSTEVALWHDGTPYRNTTAIVASIFNSTAQFEIGRRNAAATFYGGGVAFAFLCAAAAPDAVINNLFEQTRAAFGV